MHGIKLDPYEPTSTDLAFTAKMLGSLTMNGIWGNKRAAMMYQKTGDNAFKLMDYMTADQGREMGMDDETLESMKQAQARDHHAMKACCKKLGIDLEDSIIDERGDR